MLRARDIARTRQSMRYHSTTQCPQADTMRSKTQVGLLIRAHIFLKILSDAHA